MNVPCKSTDVFDREYIRFLSVGPILMGSVLDACIVHWTKVLDHYGSPRTEYVFFAKVSDTEEKYC